MGDAEKFDKKHSRARFILPNWALIIRQVRLILIRDYVTPPAGGSLIRATSVPEGDPFAFIKMKNPFFSETVFFIFRVQLDFSFIEKSHDLW